MQRVLTTEGREEHTHLRLLIIERCEHPFITATATATATEQVTELSLLCLLRRHSSLDLISQPILI